MPIGKRNSSTAYQLRVTEEEKRERKSFVSILMYALYYILFLFSYSALCVYVCVCLPPPLPPPILFLFQRCNFFIVKRDWINVCLCLVLPTLWHSSRTVLHRWYGKPMWLYNIIRLFVHSFARKKELFCFSPHTQLEKHCTTPKILVKFVWFLSHHHLANHVDNNFKSMRTMMHNNSHFYILIHLIQQPLCDFFRVS